MIYLNGGVAKFTGVFASYFWSQLISNTFKNLAAKGMESFPAPKKLICYWKVTVVVLLLSGQFRPPIFILGSPGTCENYGMFQCNNGKCIHKFSICNGIDNCDDNSDESKIDGAFCGMCAWFFCAFNTNIQSMQLEVFKSCGKKQGFIKNCSRKNLLCRQTRLISLS